MLLGDVPIGHWVIVDGFLLQVVEKTESEVLLGESKDSFQERIVQPSISVQVNPPSHPDIVKDRRSKTLEIKQAYRTREDGLKRL